MSLQTTATAARRRLRTIGVEEELLLVDATTMSPVPVAGLILDAIDGGAESTAGAVLEFEAKHEQIEAISPPLETFDELLAAILHGRRTADSAAREVGARAVAVATAPLPCVPHLVASPRYQLMHDRFGLTMDEQLTCGFHVHVSVQSDEEGVAALDRIRPWLPVLLAISTNSPYWQGTDTGFASYRYQAWGRWPSAGPYDLFGSASDYHRQIDDILATDVSLDAGMVYFDARLSRHAPTVEVRIADVCLHPADAALLAVITRALVETAVDEWSIGMPPNPVSTSLLRLASWRASKSGLDGALLHPETGRPVPAVVAVDALFAHVRGSFSSGEEERFVQNALRTTLRRGSGARRQRTAMGPAGSSTDVIATAARDTITA
ncbi:glutamate--cysteine ligase [Glaciihabitans sp. dw_435]|uniref:glutamate--cysteine ligase n=1 Tax=Glaciihabitans sp. dw_435 TaxID=2720081 RepID=UPI001BD56F49|nr:glutamate--cysteine ligase [Glaciihabitans sp. dw_435]